ncbi:MAG TPA: S9 family peptidase [Steroidobacteraceae bacterium]|jgi:dipeptidyl aminopeptidase/acylaminoacyl peptidase|nr:S9 family peptidase [Steroidobacteraceae bacterium]
MPFTVEQYAALGRVSEVAASPCGSWLAVTLQRPDRDGAKYVSDLWRVPTDGGCAVQLTRGDSKDHAPCFRHDGTLAFLSNRTPNEIKADDEAAERKQVWVLPAGGGEPRQLTDQPLGVNAFRCAKRAARMVLLTPVLAGVEQALQRESAARRRKGGPSARRFRSQPVRHWDEWLHQNPDLPCDHLIACDAEGGQCVDLTPTAQGEFAIDPGFDISSDGARVVATRLNLGKDRILDSALLLIDLDSGSSRVLGVTDSVTLDEAAFSPDGRYLAAVRTARSVARAMQPRIALIEVSSGNVRELGGVWDGWAGAPRWSPTGRQIYFCADEQGRAPIFVLDTDSGAVKRLGAAAAGGVYEHLSILEDGRIAGIHSTLLTAPECFVLDPQASAPARPLARLSGFAGAQEWAQVEDFSIRSTDGMPIQAFLVRPRGVDSAARLPLALWIHGGPIGANHDGWHWRWNPLLLVAQGYAVALPNPRGSSGFGQDFIQGIWGNVWGDQCFKDLMCVTDALCARGDIDPERTMAMGGSFGGYMTNWIGTQSARFKCLITHASIATMAQFTGTTDHPGWWYLEMGGENPYLDRERFDRYAPLRQVGNWRTPVLIIHGERDYRCPISEALNLFEALQYHGVPSELLVFPDENHWILKPRNVIAWYQAVIEFTARYL